MVKLITFKFKIHYKYFRSKILDISLNNTVDNYGLEIHQKISCNRTIIYYLNSEQYVYYIIYFEQYN